MVRSLTPSCAAFRGVKPSQILVDGCLQPVWREAGWPDLTLKRDPAGAPDQVEPVWPSATGVKVAESSWSIGAPRLRSGKVDNVSTGPGPG